MRNYANKCAIGQPRAWLYKGICHWLQGQTWRAKRAWRKSLHHAKNLAMPYEEALAHYQIGRLLPVDDSTRQEHLTQAVEMFTRLEATLDLGRAKQAFGHKD